MKTLVVAAAICAALLLPGLSPAQTTTPALPTDVVLLQDGSMVRGTITELQVGQFLVIMGVDGSLKRYTFDAVKYAGPAKDAPAPEVGDTATGPTKAAVADAYRRRAAQVQLVASQPGVRFYRRTEVAQATVVAAGAVGRGSASNYVDLCGAPCEVTLPAGRYTLGVSQDSSDIIDTVVDLPPGTSKVEGTYVSHAAKGRAEMVAGVITLVVGGVLAGVGLAQQSQQCDVTGCYQKNDPNVPLLAVGSAIFLGGTILFIKGTWEGDEVRLRVVPEAAALKIPGAGAHELTGRTTGLSLALDW